MASPGGFGAWNKRVGGILNQQAIQEGWDFLGHVDIPHTPFTLFGLFQQFLPNTHIEKNPLDFQRYDLGVQWLINKYLRVSSIRRRSSTTTISSLCRRARFPRSRWHCPSRCRATRTRSSCTWSSGTSRDVPGAGASIVDARTGPPSGAFDLDAESIVGIDVLQSLRQFIV